VSRGRLGLAGRLFLAQMLVVVIGIIAVGLVAAAVGPPIFHEHLRRAGQMPADASGHVEQAYVSASAVSLGVALIVALAAALTVSAYLARRVAQPVAAVAGAAADVAGGRYTVRVPAAHLGRDFDTLTGAFNLMAGRLEAVEATRRQMLADLAHEMRTPLATLEAYLEAAEDGVAVPDEDAVAVMRTQTVRLRRLAEDISAVSRAEENQLDLRPRRVAAADLVAAAVNAARAHYAAKDVALRYQVSDRLPDVLADPDRIGQVLANLLENALRHTPPAGAVTVHARATGGGVQLSVADTGEGIPAEHLPHLFERFYRADTARDRSQGGSGIGLAVVRAVVTAHGGQVEAASGGPGAGATFTVTLPAVTIEPDDRGRRHRTRIR
jgi:two-component system sensor histidine kinase BaeS